MKAFVTYDNSGRVTAVGIPNPDFGDDLVVEPAAGEFVVAIDVGTVVKGATELTFAGADEKGAKRLQEAVRTIVEQYRVDPATRRLLAKKAT